MKKKIAFILSTLTIASTAIYAGSSCCAGYSGDKTKTAQPIGMDVVETAMGSDSFTTLVAAIQAAGLVDALQDANNITVFAPTNEAFAALPDGVLEMLLLPENKDSLTKILTYHVIPVEVMAADVSPGTVNTLEGSPVTIEVTDGVVTVGGATVIQTDIEASNGVIHVIDQVILPPDLAL